MVKSILSLIKENRWIRIVLCVQLFVLLAAVFYLLRPRFTYTIPGSAIVVPEWSTFSEHAGVGDDNSLVISVPDTGEEIQEDIIGELPIELPKRGGAYRFIFRYEDAKGGNAKFSEAQCYLDIYGAEDRTLFDKQYLYRNVGESKGIVWILPSPQRFDLHYYLINAAAGDVRVKSVTVEESIAFRISLILIWLLACSLFWGLYALLRKIPVKAQITFLLLAGICFLSSYPLFAKGVFDTKDLLFHLKRIGYLAEGMTHGDFNVWYEADAANGYGYVEQIFYPKFLLHVAAFFHMLDLPLYSCYKFYLLLLNVLTVGVSYRSFRGIFSSRVYGVLATAIYMLSIYRFLNLYGMNALGELAAKIFLPLLCYGFWKIFRENGSGQKLQEYVPLIISGIGLVYSHVLSCELLLLLIPLFLLMNYRDCISFVRIRRMVQSVAIVFVCCLGFIVPFLHGLRIFHMEVNKFDGMFDISGYAISLMQLFNNVIQEKDSAKTGGAMALLVIVLWIVWCIVRKSRQLESDRANRFMRSLFVLFMFSLWACTDLFPWVYMPFLPAGISSAVTAIQFPWRFLTFVTLFSALLIPYTISRLSEHVVEDRTMQRAAEVCACLLVAGLCAYNSFDFAGNYLQDTEWIRPMYATNEINNALALRDYVPEGVHGGDFDTSEFVASNGSIRIRAVEGKAGIRSYEIENAGADGYVEIPVFAYSLMRTDTLGWEEGDRGRMRLSVPEGFAGTCMVWFETPILWTVMQYVSFFAIALVIGWIITLYKRTRQKPEV